MPFESDPIDCAQPRVEPPSAFAHYHHPLVDKQNVSQFSVELRIAPLQIVADLVRSQFVSLENFGNRASRQLRQAWVTFRRAVSAGMAGKQPGRPQLLRVAQFLRLAACQRHHPSARLGGNIRRSNRPSQVALGQRHASRSLRREALRQRVRDDPKGDVSTLRLHIGAVVFTPRAWAAIITLC